MTNDAGSGCVSTGLVTFSVKYNINFCIISDIKRIKFINLKFIKIKLLKSDIDLPLCELETKSFKSRIFYSKGKQLVQYGMLNSVVCS